MATEIRRVLKMYDDSAVAAPRLAVSMLKEVTKSLASDPARYDLLEADAELWGEAGGHSYSENHEFPDLVRKRWVERLSKADIMSAGLDKEEWAQLLADLTGYAGKLESAELEFDMEEITALIQALKEKAPDPEDSSDEDDE